MRRITIALGLLLTAGAAAGACAKFSPATSDNPAENVYNQAGCITCHGKTGAGADGPNLLERPLTRASIIAKIRSGGGTMPSYSDGKPPDLSPEQIELAAQWVEELRRRAGVATPPS